MGGARRRPVSKKFCLFFLFLFIFFDISSVQGMRADNHFSSEFKLKQIEEERAEKKEAFAFLQKVFQKECLSFSFDPIIKIVEAQVLEKSLTFPITWNLFIQNIQTHALLSLAIDALHPEEPCLTSKKLNISRNLIQLVQNTSSRVLLLFETTLLQNKGREKEIKIKQHDECENNTNTKKPSKSLINVKRFILDVCYELVHLKDRLDFDIVLTTPFEMQHDLKAAHFNVSLVSSLFSSYCLVTL